ncbi:hypothetical protein FRC01_001538 [Tulasnella sp. 417]|nr:hypothetical protein FRC01_001538 [Tulasnella sp. 417]
MSLRNALLNLLVKAHDTNFKPPTNWSQGVEEAKRVDDFLWVTVVAQSMRNKHSDPNGIEQVESIARELLSDLDEAIREQKLETTKTLSLEQSESPRKSNLSRVPLNANFQLTDEQAKSIIVEPTPRVFGIYSDVYEGRWTSPWTGKDETVSVKVIRSVGHPESAEESRALDFAFTRLEQEVSIWQKLNNPRITPILGYARTARMIAGEDKPAMILPWRALGALDEYLKVRPQTDKLPLLIQAAEAVDILHTLDPNPISHLHIKPDKFLVNDNVEVELCYFGMSRILAHPQFPTSSTTAVLSDSVGYLAPECLTNGTQSTAADVYAFGGVMLKVLTGKPPFADMTPARLISNEYQLSCPPAIADELWELMDECWKSAPTERPTMAVVIERLRNLRLPRELGHAASFNTSGTQLNRIATTVHNNPLESSGFQDSSSRVSSFQGSSTQVLSFQGSSAAPEDLSPKYWDMWHQYCRAQYKVDPPCKIWNTNDDKSPKWLAQTEDPGDGQEYRSQQAYHKKILAKSEAAMFALIAKGVINPLNKA